MTFKELEKIREEYKVKYIRHTIIASCIMLPFFLLFFGPFFLTGDYFAIIAILFFIIFVVAFSFGIAGFTTRKIATEYTKAYKAYFVESSLTKVFTDLKYNHAEGFSRQYIRDTGLLSTGDRFNSNDLTIGKYKNIQFAQADAHVETQHTDSEGHTSYVTIFLGRYIVYEFGRDFRFNLQLFGKRFSAVGSGGLSRKNHKYEKIKTESNDFNKLFKIRSQDGFEAFYILDPAFIEKIQSLYDYSKGRIALGFQDKKLHIAISNGKDSFEPPRPFKPIDEKAEFEKTLADIKVITDFVDFLSLDKKLFKN